MSIPAVVSPGTRFVAVLEKATNRPSAERQGEKESPFAWMPEESTLTRVVAPVIRSWTKTSLLAFVSPGTRFVARLSNATMRPSRDIETLWLPPLDCVPSEATLTRVVAAGAAAERTDRANATNSCFFILDSPD